MKIVLAGVKKTRRVLPWIVVTSVLVLVLAAGNGCSVYMAAKQPDKKNLNILAVGTPRSLVLAEIGQPKSTETRDGKRVDVFSFVQGYSKGAKVGRAFWHGAADVFTLGLWEVVGTPTESIFTGEKVAYEVTYTTDDKVEKVVTLIHHDNENKAQPAENIKGESMATQRY
ncbi:MAG: hypothetical protein A4E64_01588 [Syntrophorhabdus sp. PtaU1.Bin058]|nr:MAG: hypothetical protein A4E64_01588 [Syntrophorhabdus sp. PtaU1.Bin058]